MPEQGWLVYLGAITGVIGTVSGVAGAFFAFKALHRTGELKELDLRLELRRTEATLQAEIRSLGPLLETAKQSRKRLAAAQGNYHSGATAHWLSDWSTDQAEANALLADASVLDIDCSQFTQAQLESRLIAVHRLRNEVLRLSMKYHDSIANDDVGRTQLREDQRLLTQARLDGKL